MHGIAVMSIDPLRCGVLFINACTGMTVSWYTAVQGADPPTVLYGSSPHALNESAYGNTHAYSPSDGWFHDVVLTGLQPNTLYYYLILAPAFNGTVPVYNFTTARAAGDTTPFSVLVVGDVGLVNSQRKSHYFL